MYFVEEIFAWIMCLYAMLRIGQNRSRGTSTFFQIVVTKRDTKHISQKQLSENRILLDRCYSQMRNYPIKGVVFAIYVTDKAGFMTAFAWGKYLFGSLPWRMHQPRMVKATSVLARICNRAKIPVARPNSLRIPSKVYKRPRFCCFK